MLGNSMRFSRGLITLVVSILFVATFVGLVFNHLGSWQIPIRSKAKFLTGGKWPTIVDDTGASQLNTVSSRDQDGLRDFYLKQLFRPSIKPNTVSYKPRDAFQWNLAETPHWQQSMFEKLCIIDLDNRNFDEAGEVFGPDAMDWGNASGAHVVHGLSLGLLNHYVYARIHGYKYYFVNISDPHDRRASWKKPSIISRILKEHDVCIYLDSDAIFYNLDMPFEWLMNYWKLNPDKNSMALAVDPNFGYNKDKFGKLYLNTGFIVSQNNPTTHKIMDDWSRCPDDDGPYPGCDKFRFSWPGQPTDQGGFGTFVRYNYTEHIRELPCTEANGYPLSRSGCEGKFIRHMWTGKDNWLKLEVGQQLPGPFLRLFHEQYVKDKPTFYIEEADLLEHGPSRALEGNTEQ
ncbi:hypothetical protein E4U21_005780 [Claviceps maximensis]|nr:hypothetical protein E4U21_005780 [Claviceps maximensis]